ncbi:unnamed protein product [Durusdinium trenchii]|uniref:Uncharacterized protein n=2 Tax=Durusdinium trenchii TaxID=1381693 RepID=A0ABP0HQC4_9DINO
MIRALVLFAPFFLAPQCESLVVTWTEQTASPDDMWIESICMTPDGNTRLAPDGNNRGNLWTSSDAGATWVEYEGGSGPQHWKSCAVSADGSKMVAGAGGSKIWVSSDGGSTWTENQKSRSWNGVAMSSDGTKIAGAANPGKLVLSIDGGATWQELLSAASGVNQKWNAIAMSADGTKIVTAVEDGNIWVSSDSGATWQEDTSVGSTQKWRRVVMSADGTKMVAQPVEAGQSSIWLSSDAGATWQETSTGLAWQSWLYWADVAMSESGDIIAALAYSTDELAVSMDGGATWSAVEVRWAQSFRSIALSADGRKIATSFEAKIFGGTLDTTTTTVSTMTNTTTATTTRTTSMTTTMTMDSTSDDGDDGTTGTTGGNSTSSATETTTSLDDETGKASSHAPPLAVAFAAVLVAMPLMRA